MDAWVIQEVEAWGIAFGVTAIIASIVVRSYLKHLGLV